MLSPCKTELWFCLLTQIYDSNAEHNALFEYWLPLWTAHIIYTDRLIFTALSNQHILVLANQLSEKDSQHSQVGCHYTNGHSVCRILFWAWYILCILAKMAPHVQREEHSTILHCSDNAMSQWLRMQSVIFNLASYCLSLKLSGLLKRKNLSHSNIFFVL